MMRWLERALRAAAAGEPGILVTVTAALGSVPREPGTSMLVLRDEIHGSIGGGHLEFAATQAARRLLAEREPRGIRLESVALGPALGQCCGGKVELAYEPLGADDAGWLGGWAALIATEADGIRVRQLHDLHPAHAVLVLQRDAIDSAALPGEIRRRASALLNGRDRIALVDHSPDGGRFLIERTPPSRACLYLFGAGHVGQAIVRAFASLPFRIRWIDGRPDSFPSPAPADVDVLVCAEPATVVADAVPDTFFLVMTHSHPLDLEICEAVLRRGDAAFLGLIGSETKCARFVSQLRARGLSGDAVGRLTCPIGLPEIAGKEPAVIAVSVAAQLLALSEQIAARSATPQGRRLL